MEIVTTLNLLCVPPYELLRPVIETCAIKGTNSAGLHIFYPMIWSPCTYLYTFIITGVTSFIHLVLSFTDHFLLHLITSLSLSLSLSLTITFVFTIISKDSSAPFLCIHLSSNHRSMLMRKWARKDVAKHKICESIYIKIEPIKLGYYLLFSKCIRKIVLYENKISNRISNPG